MRAFIRRHTTLFAFSVCLGSSVAFVACGGDDSTSGGPGPEYDAGSGGSSASGGRGNGGASAGGANAGGAATGGRASGGAGSGGEVIDSGADVVTSNGDAMVDGAFESDAAAD